MDCVKLLVTEIFSTTGECMPTAQNLALVKSLPGDIIILPDGARKTLRARIDLAPPIADVASVLIAGDIAVHDARLMTLPAAGAEIGVYAWVPELPPGMSIGSELAHGATSYLAPHLEYRSGGQGELQWRLVTVRGAHEPAVITFVSGSRQIWIHVGTLDSSELQVQVMERASLDEHAHAVVRETSRSLPTHRPINVPIPAEVEQPLKVG